MAKDATHVARRVTTKVRYWGRRCSDVQSKPTRQTTEGHQQVPKTENIHMEECRGGQEKRGCCGNAAWYSGQNTNAYDTRRAVVLCSATAQLVSIAHVLKTNDERRSALAAQQDSTASGCELLQPTSTLFLLDTDSPILITLMIAAVKMDPTWEILGIGLAIRVGLCCRMERH